MGMENTNDYTLDYSTILEHYSEDEIVTRFQTWYRETQYFIQAFGLSNVVRVDTKKLGYAVCDYFSDIIRTKEFHDIEHANLSKIYAYSSYWFLRECPLQLISPVEDDLLFINEVYIVINLWGKISKRCPLKPEGNEDFIGLALLWLYNFKYRTYTAQSLEMALSSFFVAYKGAGENFDDAI